MSLSLIITQALLIKGNSIPEHSVIPLLGRQRKVLPELKAYIIRVSLKKKSKQQTK